MVDSDNADGAELSKSAAKLLHDLQGPLLNAKSFHEEMKEAVTRMQALLPSDDAQLAQADMAELRELLVQDLVPCLDYATQAVEQCQSRVAQFQREGIA